MLRIRWDENIRKSYAKQRFFTSVAITIAPVCRCGATMRRRAGYLMGGDNDWVAYECPKDRPWTFFLHDPWTTLRQDPNVRFTPTREGL